MRRLATIAASATLTVALAGSVSAAPKNFFNGDFDMLLDGTVVGHVTVRIWETNFSGPTGTYRVTLDSGTGIAQIGEASFLSDPEPHVWFKAMEIGYDGSYPPGYSVFAGHIVDVADGPDTIEFYGRHLEGDAPGDIVLGDLYHFAFEVGEGTFVLHIGG